MFTHFLPGAQALQTPEALDAMRAALSMTKQRCYNPECADYKYYGALGIKVCERWLESFDNFVADMGVRPEGMTLERKDVHKDYTPDNCVWATRKTQARNRGDSLTLTVDGVKRPLAEWAELTGIAYHTLKARKTRLGYTDAQCVSKEVKAGGKLEGRTYKPRTNPDPSVYPRGLASKLARYSLEELKVIQADYDSAPQSFSAMARKYNCSVTTMSNICQKKEPYANLTNA